MKNIHSILEGVYEDEALRRTIVPLFISNPGMGKSQIIKQFAESKGARIVELITSTMNPFEVSGIAMPDKEKGKMTYFDFDNLLSLKDGDILFFDELLNGNPAVLNACLTILEQRKFISGAPLPNIMIVAAANPQGAPVLTPQIKERFVWYDLRFDSPMWQEYMREKYAMPNSISFELVSLINKEDYKETNLNTARSIDKAVKMIIADIPTPYAGAVKPLLDRLVTNPLGGDIQLTEDFLLKKSEKIQWLELMRLIKEQKLTEDEKTRITKI